MTLMVVWHVYYVHLKHRQEFFIRQSVSLNPAHFAGSADVLGSKSSSSCHKAGVSLLTWRLWKTSTFGHFDLAGLISSQHLFTESLSMKQSSLLDTCSLHNIDLLEFWYDSTCGSLKNWRRKWLPVLAQWCHVRFDHNCGGVVTVQ